MKPYSIGARLACMFALAASCVFALAGIALYLFQSMELRRHQAEELRTRFEVVESLLMHHTTASKWPRFTEKLADFTPSDGSLRFYVLSDDPRFRFGEDLPPEAIVAEKPSGFGKAHIGDSRFATLSKILPANGERPDVRLIIADDCKGTEQAELALGLAILMVSVLTAILVGALGWWIARRGLAPVDRLSAFAGRLGAGDLALRLPTDTLPPELSGLVLALNGALDRLQTSYVQLAAFNADVAHELRTPLGNLIGETQVALGRRRSVDELEDVLQSNLEELNRLRTIINDMLFLARADQGAVADNMIDTPIAEETAKSAEFLDMIFEDAGVTLHIQGNASARVDRALYGRAITNLLDNAIRHGCGGSAVTVTIEPQGRMVCIGVRNRGAPIPADRIERLFDRFYRIDQARLNSGESHGLGLAIVKAVATMHGGSVFARSEHDEIVVGFTVPIARDPATQAAPANLQACLHDNAA